MAAELLNVTMPGERDVEVEIERPLREGAVLAEVVNDAAHVARASLSSSASVSARGSRVDHDRLPELTRERDGAARRPASASREA